MNNNTDQLIKLHIYANNKLQEVCVKCCLAMVPQILLS